MEKDDKTIKIKEISSALSMKIVSTIEEKGIEPNFDNKATTFLAEALYDCGLEAADITRNFPDQIDYWKPEQNERLHIFGGSFEMNGVEVDIEFYYNSNDGSFVDCYLLLETQNQEAIVLSADEENKYIGRFKERISIKHSKPSSNLDGYNEATSSAKTWLEK